MTTEAGPGAEAAAHAFYETIVAITRRMPSGWIRRFGSAEAIVTGVSVPTLNGCPALDPSVRAEDLVAALTEVERAGVPYNIQARPGCAAEAERAAETMAMIAAPAPIPLLVRGGDPLPADLPVPGLTIRRLHEPEVDLHSALAARAFDAEPEMFDAVTRPTLDMPGACLYLGEVDGEPVVTALALTVGEATGVFNVATPPEHRRRGYAAAITARAISDAAAAGAAWSWLQSSAPGLGVYEALGFTVVETWDCWVSL